MFCYVIDLDCKQFPRPDRWPSDNAFVSRGKGLRFESWADQIEHSVANCSPPLRHFSGRSCVVRVQLREEGPRKIVDCNCNYTFIYQAVLARRQQRDFLVFESS